MVDSNMLANRCILVVEDEVIVAYDLMGIIEEAEGTVVGPAHTVGGGKSYLDRCHMDAALLDVNLGNELVFALADALQARDIPIVFLTGNSKELSRTQYRHCRFLDKPYSAPMVVNVLSEVIAADEMARDVSHRRRRFR